MASASRPVPPASAFRHPASQSGTETFRYRTVPGIGNSVHSGTSVSFSPAFRHLKTLCEDMKKDTPCTSIQLVAKRDTPCTEYSKDGYTLHVHTADGVGWKRIHHHVHTLLVVERDTPKRPPCWLWKRIHPHFHAAGGGNVSTIISKYR